MHEERTRNIYKKRMTKANNSACDEADMEIMATIIYLSAISMEERFGQLHKAP
jgi:hypothetical protein